MYHMVNNANNEIEVSIVCNAYNHENYIRSALEGFVMQETTFPFEVLIHDDASTDNTATIIREYEKKYPSLIKAIYEKENQYSKHDGSLVRIQYGRVKGKYIAICEGDDYWTDPQKLQKQFEALEAHPEIDICACEVRREKDGQICGQVAPSKVSKIFSVEEVIQGGGGFVGTASLMYRSRIRDNPLPFFKIIFLDYTTQICGSLRGGMLYLAEPMGVYRVLINGSWSQRMRSDLVKNQLHSKKVEEMLLCLDRDTEFKYHNCIMEKISMNEFNSKYSAHNYSELLDKRYSDIFKRQSIRKKLIIVFGAKFPNAVGKIMAAKLWK